MRASSPQLRGCSLGSCVQAPCVVTPRTCCPCSGSWQASMPTGKQQQNYILRIASEPQSGTDTQSTQSDNFVSLCPLSILSYCSHPSSLPTHAISLSLSSSRLNLSSEVDLKKLRFFSVPHDGGSPLVSPVDPQLIQAQNRVRRKENQDRDIKTSKES